MNDLITVIVPVFNAEKWINKCIDSLLNQTYKNIEILLVDDKSEDNSLRILEQYAKNNEKIRIIIKETNSGVSDSRNIGIKNSKGKFITFVDADDTIDKDFIKQSYEIALKNNADIVCGGFNLIEENKNSLIRFYKNKVYDDKKIKDIIMTMLTNRSNDCDPAIFGFSCGKLYKKDIINEIRFNKNIRFREDTIFNIQAYSNAKVMYTSNSNWYNYIVNNNSASYRFFDDYEEEIVEFFNIIDIITSKYKLNKEISICGLYMYMNLLKHNIMHKDFKGNEAHRNEVIKNTFKSDLWRKFFFKAEYKDLKLQYKLLMFMFRNKMAIGIKILFKLNEIKR